jgi:hypothetical protein
MFFSSKKIKIESVARKMMDEEDDGYFHYDDRYAPLCTKPPPHQLSDFQNSMQGVVTQYLQESYKDGVKHTDAVLSNGLCAGEAAVLYLREQNSKRSRAERINHWQQALLQKIAQALWEHMEIDARQPRFTHTFQKHINQDLFAEKQYQRRLMPAIKAFLKEVNMKTKGYTYKLRQIMSELQKYPHDCTDALELSEDTEMTPASSVQPAQSVSTVPASSTTLSKPSSPARQPEEAEEEEEFEEQPDQDEPEDEDEDEEDLD